jgi:tight adherence protein B
VTHRPPTCGRSLRGLAICVSLAVSLFGGLIASAPASVAAGPSQTSEFALSEGSGTVFPGRSLILSVPNRGSLSSAEVHISENGQPVSQPIVTPLSKAAAGDFGVVLAIDKSPSMEGAPLRNAMAAARALAAHRSGKQQLGVIEFDETPTVALPLTANGEAITQALAHTPRVGAGTHIYDATAVALQQLQAARVTAGAVIVLSDGADRGSASSEGAVARTARAAHVSLYTVGVRDGAFDASSLSVLARDGGGQFLVADSSRLPELLLQLETGLVDRYVIHYSSRQAPGRRIEVQVQIAGLPGSAALEYLAPSQTRAITKPAKSRSFWVSTAALVVISIGVALLLGIALVTFLAPRVRRDRLRRRVAGFTHMAPEGNVSANLGVAVGVRFARLERLLERSRRWPKIKEEVEIAQFQRPAVELVALYAVATTVAALLLSLAIGSAVIALVVLALGPLVLSAVVRRRLRKTRDLFVEQLPGHLEELASAMRAGHSFISGINAVANAAIEPSRSEWRRVLADEQLGVPLEAALAPLRRRMDCDDIRQLALVATLQQTSGGNMADVIDRIAVGVRERANLRRELVALTAQARLSRWVVTAIPPMLILVLSAIQPHYMEPLLYTGGGQLMLALAFVLVVSGSLIMRKITDIKA